MNLWLQLGLGGGALFILYTFINKLFAYLKERNDMEKQAGKKSNESTIASINRLCEKLDKLVDAFHTNTEEVNKFTTSNSKDQQLIKDTTDMQFNLLKEINEKVERIDVRTCLMIQTKEIKKEVG